MGIPKESFPEEQIPAARALEVVKELIATPEGRRAYKAAPQRAFDDLKSGLDDPRLQEADYGDIPENSARALEALSVYELELFSDLDRTFVEDGLFVEVPSPGTLHFN
jgi:hypothetical protein